MFKWFLVVLHRTVCHRKLTKSDTFRLCFTFLTSPLQSSLQETQRMLILALEPMTNPQVVVSSKAIFVIWEFEVLMMEGDALLCLSTIKKIDCHPVSSQRHSNLVLHCFCKTQESLVKLHCWLICPLLLVNHTKVEGQMCFFLDILSAHPCLCSHQQLSQRAFLAGQQWHRRSISWSRTDGGSNRAVGHIRWLNSDLFLVEIHRTARFIIRKVLFKQFYAFIIMLPYLSLLHFFHLFLVRRSPRSFFKLQ